MIWYFNGRGTQLGTTPILHTEFQAESLVVEVRLSQMAW